MPEQAYYKTLKELPFSDIILTSRTKSALVKGVPGGGKNLYRPPKNLSDEVRDFVEHLDAEFSLRTGWKFPPKANIGPLDHTRPTHLQMALKAKPEQAQEDKPGSRGEALAPAYESFRYSFGGCLYRVTPFDDYVEGFTYYLRKIMDTVPDLRAVGLPKAFTDWLLDERHNQGLVLMAGGQGSGKTTTASAFIRTRLALYGGHAVTFEDPIELPLSGPWGRHAWCFQNESRTMEDLERKVSTTHRLCFPDIIFVGEIRNEGTAANVLKVALSARRQIVVATIHGSNIETALERLVSWAALVDGRSIASQNLSQTLLAALFLEIDDANESHRKKLQLLESLLVPFGPFEESLAVRSKIKAGTSFDFTDTIRRQRSWAMDGKPLDGKLLDLNEAQMRLYSIASGVRPMDASAPLSDGYLPAASQGEGEPDMWEGTKE